MTSQDLINYLEDLRAKAQEIDALLKANTSMDATIKSNISFLVGQIFASKAFQVNEKGGDKQ